MPPTMWQWSVRVRTVDLAERRRRADRFALDGAAPFIGAKSSGDGERCGDLTWLARRMSKPGNLSYPPEPPNLIRVGPNGTWFVQDSCPGRRKAQLHAKHPLRDLAPPRLACRGGGSGVCGLCPPLPAAQALQAPCTNRAQVEVGLWSVCAC